MATPLLPECSRGRIPEGWALGNANACSIDSVLQAIHGLSNAGRLYRGESSLFPSRKPSLGRLCSENLGVEDAIRLEHAGLAIFKNKAHPFIQLADQDLLDTVIGTMMLMQHHGAPTRLLDWTKSAWVAAYHATADRPECDGHIWTFPIDALERSSDQAWYDGLKRLGEVEELDDWEEAARALPAGIGCLAMVQSTSRIVAQQGMYTIASPPLLDHAVLIGDRLRDQPRSAAVLRIPAQLKQELRRILYEMNLNASALFPGMDGAGREVAELWRWQTPIMGFRGFPRGSTS